MNLQSVEVMGTISNMLMGYLYPGRPIALLVFESFCTSTLVTTIGFLSEFKLGHYMKIPPKSMFVAQVIASMVATLVSLGTNWWILLTVDHICDPKHLPKGSPWTCPVQSMINNNSVSWGLVGPKRVYFPDGIYSGIFLFFLIGLMAPVCVWILMKLFPRQKWIKDINTPLIFGVGHYLIFSGPVNYWSFIFVGVFFNLIVYRKYKTWWSKYNYVMANGLDLGVGFQGLLASFTQISGIYGINWWGLGVGDHCPLAKCPTDSTVRVEGCPIV